MTSGGASDTRSPVSPSGMSLPPVGATPTAASVGAVKVHRARELKWISAMSSTPSSHARKSKKIRELLQEGVPASVRYQVWAHLTDSRAKRIEGLYIQLGEREKVPAFAEIQRDAQLFFSQRCETVATERPPGLALAIISDNGPGRPILQWWFFFSFVRVWKV
jgi:hypothetical protein